MVGSDVTLSWLLPGAVPDEVGLVPVQLAHLQRDDPAGGVGERTEGQDGIHPKGRDGLESSLLAHQHRIVHSAVPGILLSCIAKIDRNADNFEVICRTFAAQAFQERNFPAAGLAPAGPEIHHQRAALPIGEPVPRAVQPR